jgi:hypothetical protein
MKSLKKVYDYLTNTNIIITFHPKAKKPEPPQLGRQQSKIEFPLAFRLYDLLVRLQNYWEVFREKHIYTTDQSVIYNWKKTIQQQKGEFENNVRDI